MKKKLFFEAFFPITCIIGLSISKINLNIFNLSQLSGLAYHHSLASIMLFYTCFLVLIKFIVFSVIRFFKLLNEFHQFSLDVLRILGREMDFIYPLMYVEHDGNRGMIIGISESGDLLIDFLDKEKFKSPMCCNPKQKIKYFDEKGNVVTSYD